MSKFIDIVTTKEELRAIISEPGELVTRKILPRLDKYCTLFIGRSPFVLLATSDSDGNIDISPKGDSQGFVKILDSQTLVIPDRPGNHRADSMEYFAESESWANIFDSGKN